MKDNHVSIVNDENILTNEELRTLKNMVRWWTAGKLAAIAASAVISIGFTIIALYDKIRDHINFK